MVGMLEIMTYLFCIYLVFKGVEILQIGIMGSQDRRVTGVSIGAVMVVVALIFAVVFAILITNQADAVSDGMKNVPSFPTPSR